MRDLIIRGGTIVDGSGGASFEGDVAIDGDRIVEVGKALGAAHREIDARGLLVTPGFVDIHTHYDGQATWDPLLAPSSWHGVTTAIMGNCGVGFAPVRPDQHAFLIALMEGVEDIPGTALAEGIDWRWERFGEYLDALQAMPRAVDVGAQVPHGAVRAYVLGERCNTDYVPNEAEIAQMAALVREGVAAGALGFSTSRTLLHRDVGGVNVPGTFAGSDEMLALGLAMKGLSHGVYGIVSDHLGDEREWSWMRAFARETGLPMNLVPVALVGSPAGWRLYDTAEAARAEGLEIRTQITARPTGVLHGLTSNIHLFTGHPTYKRDLAHLPLAEKVAAMRRPEVKAALLAEKAPPRGGLLGDDPDAMLYRVFPLGERPDYEPDRSASVGALAEAAQVAPMAMMYELLLCQDGRELFYQPLSAYGDYTFDPFLTDIRHPNVLFGLSDAGAHCGVIADASMPTFILTHWARDRVKGEKLPLEFLVRKLTRETALAFGLADRGELALGRLADVNVIDFERLRLHRPEAVYDLPAGGRRMVQRAEGYRHTIKSGQVTFEDGAHTGALPGSLVRGPTLPA